MSPGPGNRSRAPAAAYVAAARPAAVRPRVVMVQRTVPHYRRPFYDGLADELGRRGLDLGLVYGQAQGDEVSRRDKADLQWGTRVDAREVRVAGRTVAWQPALRHVRGADLVVVGQESKLLLNHLLFLRQLAGHERLAFWGHGRNFQQGSASGFGEAVKRFTSRRVHWWFAYNDVVADIVARMGYPTERITDVRNSIDVEGLRRDKAAVGAAEIDRTLAAAGLRGRNLTVFSGGLYAQKRLDLLLDAAERIRAEVSDFELVIIGGGPQEQLVREAAARHPWLYATGPLFSEDLVRWLAPAKLVLMPGLVGLVVLDSFALEAPLVTIADSEHSPEFFYLRDGENGVVLPAGTDAGGYADKVVRLLRDDAARARLVKGCQQAQVRYSMREMVTRFADGVERALAAPPLPRHG